MFRGRRFWLPVASVIVVIASGLILLHRSSEEPKSPTLQYLQRALNDIPVPAEARLIRVRYYGCSKCQFVGMVAQYATNLSPKDARTFYRTYLRRSAWRYGGEWEGHDNSGVVAQWGLEAKWPFTEARAQEQAFVFLASESKNTFDGQTVYSIQVVYTQDRAVRDRECPPDRLTVFEKACWEMSNQ